MNLQAENRPVAFGCDFKMIDVAAAMDRGHAILTPRFDPLNRLADLHRNEAHQRFFGIDIQLAAESAANFRSDRREDSFPECPASRQSACAARCGI